MTVSPTDAENLVAWIHWVAMRMSPTDDNPVFKVAGLAVTAAVESSRPLCIG